MQEYECCTPSDTIRLGMEIGKMLHEGDIVCIDGGLSVGKTHLVIGITDAIGCHEFIRYAADNVVNEYQCDFGKLYHFDVYRAPENFPYQKYFGKGICLIEWAIKIEDKIPKDTLHILIERNALSPQKRHVTIRRR